MRAAMILGLIISLVFTGAASAGGDDIRVARQHLESVSRAAVEGSFAQQSEQGESFETLDRSLMADRLHRVKHGAFSLILPGWSQYRAGDNGRALSFAAVEAVVWSTWLFSELQGDYREDRYREFAQIFAGVNDADGHDDDYWRAVGVYDSSEDFNAVKRKENRAEALDQERNGETVTIGLNDGTIASEDGWFWTSERRRIDEYRLQRSDAIAAFDRADFVLLFALVNRIVAFADAVRSAPISDSDPNALIEAKGFTLSVDVAPHAADPSAALRVGRSF